MVLLRNYTQVTNHVFQAHKLSCKAIGVYAYLKYKSYAGNSKRAIFPCQKTIMKDLKIGSDNTLRKILKELTSNGFISITKGSIFTGNSYYKLHIPKYCENNTS